MKDILYNIIIYRDMQKLEIYKEENLIFEKYYLTESEIYQPILLKTKDCKDINKIEIIYK